MKYPDFSEIDTVKAIEPPETDKGGHPHLSGPPRPMNSSAENKGISWLLVLFLVILVSLLAVLSQLSS